MLIQQVKGIVNFWGKDFPNVNKFSFWNDDFPNAQRIPKKTISVTRIFHMLKNEPFLSKISQTQKQA